MGALGPKQVEFENDGKVPPMPARLRDNAKSWLTFTDLVFVDPVGTGYSRELKGEAETFALSGYLTDLADGGLKPGWLEHTSRLMGLDSEIVARWHGRVPPARFVKALLADRRRLVSLYDGSISLIDPDPSRQLLAGGDPYLDLLNAPVTAAFNSYVRDHLEFEPGCPTCS